MSELYLYGIIGDEAAGLDAATIVRRLAGTTGPLAVRINSSGGFIAEGLAVYSALDRIRLSGRKVTVYIDGVAASMGSAVAMAGDEIIMAATNAMFMVHNPWDSTTGDARAMRKQADLLDRTRDQLVSIYGARSGIAAPDLMLMLDTETWFDADEALAAGFITAIAPASRMAACDLSTFGYRHTPNSLKAKDAPMPDNNIDTVQNAITTERTRISTIMGLGTKHRLSSAFTQDLIARGIDLGQARAAILDQLASEGDRLDIGHSNPTGSHVTLDNPATYGAAIQAALVAKIGGTAAEGPAAEFRSMSVVDMARDFLARGGERDVHRIPPDRVIGMAMQSSGGRGSRWGLGSGAITHTTSDFPDLVGGAAETFLIDRYKRQQSALKLLARKRNRADFRVQHGVQMGGFGNLDHVGEAGEFKNKTISTRKEGWKVDTYGNMFNVSRQMLVNDHLGALADILTVMAGAAAEVEATILAALINSNPALTSDGLPVFDAAHGNVATIAGAPSVATLDAGRLAMRKQKDLDGVGLIDANPKYLLVPVNLQTAAETLIASATIPSVQATGSGSSAGIAFTGDQFNPFAGKLEPIADPRIINPAAWYLFADPDFSPALEYGYLDGQEAPATFSEEGWRVDGTEYKVRHDFGAGWMDHRLAWKNPGAPTA